MALNTFKCNYLTPLHFKGLTYTLLLSSKVELW